MANFFNLQYGNFFKLPRQLVKYILSSIYPMVIKIWPLPKVLSIEETIKLITSKKISIARFGDSEFLYVIDKINLPYQRFDENLRLRLIEILLNQNDNILVGLPSGYHGLNNLINESKVFWRSQIALIYPRLIKFITIKNTYANASISRLYIELANKEDSKIYFEKIKTLWENRDLVIIEGEKSRLGVGNDLFLKANSIKRILGPAHNAFDEIDNLLKEAKKLNESVLILIAMGPTAKVIAYELSKLNYQAIDIGNIDIEYEWFKMGAKSKVKISGKYTSEAVGGRIVEDSNDQDYLSQIIYNYKK